MSHPLYAQVLARLNPFEKECAKALEIYKPDWWQMCVHPQTMLDYLNAPSEAYRVSAMTTMARDSIAAACMCHNALRKTSLGG